MSRASGRSGRSVLSVVGTEGQPSASQKGVRPSAFFRDLNATTGLMAGRPAPYLVRGPVAVLSQDGLRFPLILMTVSVRY